LTAYWVTMYRAVHDPEALARYAALAGPALVEAGAKFLVRGMPEVVHEGGLMDRTVVMEFESVEAAIAAHDGPGYQAALAELGDGAVDRDLRIVPGA